MTKIKFTAIIGKEKIEIKDDFYISFFNAKNVVDWAVYSRSQGCCIYKHDSSYPEEYEKNHLIIELL